MRALLSIQIDEHWLALDAAAVLEIRGAQGWVPIPDAPAHTPGVIAWRGRAIAVLDLVPLLRLGDQIEPGHVRPRLVVAHLGAAICGIPVDVVREVQEIAPADLHPVHATRVRFACAEVQLHERVMPLLDFAALTRELTHV